MNTICRCRPRNNLRSRSISAGVYAIQSTTASNDSPSSFGPRAGSFTSATRLFTPRGSSCANFWPRVTRVTSIPRCAASAVQAVLMIPVPPMKRTLMLDGLQCLQRFASIRFLGLNVAPGPSARHLSFMLLCLCSSSALDQPSPAFGDATPVPRTLTPAFEQKLYSEPQPPYPRVHSARRVKPIHNMSPVPSRKRLENLSRFRIFLQRHAQIARDSRFARFAIEPQRQTDFIARIRPRSLAQRSIKLHAIPPATGRHQSHPRLLAIHRSDNRNIFR